MCSGLLLPWRRTVRLTLLPGGPASRSSACGRVIAKVGSLSIAKIRSPGFSPALAAGEPSRGEITRSSPSSRLTVRPTVSVSVPAAPLSASYTVSLSTNWALAGPLPACGAGFGWAFAWAKAGGIPSAIIRIAAASPRIPLNLRKSAPAGCRLSPKTLCEESRHYHGRPHRASFFFAFPFGRENVADLADPAGRAALQLGAELVVRHQPGVRLEHLGRSRAGGEDVENRSVLERAADGEDLARGGGTGR